MARKFFLVAAGMFLLALTYHLGASTATAQAGGLIECAYTNGDYAAAVIGRQVYYLSRSEPLHLVTTSPIPGASPVIACSISMVVLENGEVWYWVAAGGPAWVLAGTFGGPTPAMHESWGQLKSRYAPSHGPTSQPPTDR